jgi:hypothetical protein
MIDDDKSAEATPATQEGVRGKDVSSEECTTTATDEEDFVKVCGCSRVFVLSLSLSLFALFSSHSIWRLVLCVSVRVFEFLFLTVSLMVRKPCGRR